MLKNNKGVTLSILVVTTIVIMILAGVTVTTADLLIRDTKSKAIVSNMYLIKGKVETIYEDYEFSGTGLVGNHVTASSLSNYGVTVTGNAEDDFWYEWGTSVIETLGFDKEMITGSAKYIINYATGEVIYSTGYKDTDTGTTKYKLSEV